MRVLHAGCLLRTSSGIERQMKEEMDAARSAGIPWDVLLDVAASDNDGEAPGKQLLPNRFTAHTLSARAWLHGRTSFYGKLKSLENSYDLILIRYSPHDPFLLSFLRRSACLVGLVHHTVTSAEYRSLPGIVNHIRGSADFAAQPLIVSQSDVSVAVTDEIAESLRTLPGRTKPSTVIMPNSIIAGGNLTPDARGQHPELLFVASEFFPWQGLDLLLDDLASTPAPFKLHVVGKVPQQQKVLARNDPRVVFHGPLSQDEIADLASSSWVGISTMAQERTGMLEACPIKVREYLSLGLPVVGSHTDVFPDDFPFYVKIAPKLTGIIQASYRARHVSREQVAAAAFPFIDKSRILSETYRQLRTVLEL